MGGTAHPRVAFRVLGPLEAVVDGRTVALGSPKVRQLLAALLVNANAVVSSDRLVEILWGDSAPMDASGALQKTVHRLRSLLKATPGPTVDDADVLVTRAPGYVLTVDAESYDAAHLEELVAEAQRSSELGDPRAALDALDDALALWRGAAFAEFASDDFARTAATRLDELRVAAIEERVEAFLALGRHDEVTGELDALVAEYPYRERLWGQLMVALYRSRTPGRRVARLQPRARAARRRAGNRSRRVVARPRRGDPAAEAGARLGARHGSARRRCASRAITARAPDGFGA
jgi:DNA-binding SARP family transcriptional activator